MPVRPNWFLREHPELIHILMIFLLVVPAFYFFYFNTINSPVLQGDDQAGSSLALMWRLDGFLPYIKTILRTGIGGRINYPVAFFFGSLPFVAATNELRAAIAAAFYFTALISIVCAAWVLIGRVHSILIAFMLLYCVPAYWGWSTYYHYVSYYTSPIIPFCWAMILFKLTSDIRRPAFLISYFILMMGAVFSYEAVLVPFLLILAVQYFSYIKKQYALNFPFRLAPIIDATLLLLPILVYLAMYVGWLMVFGWNISSIEVSSESLFSLTRFFTTLFSFSLTGLPAANFFKAGWSYTHQDIAAIAALVGLGTIALFLLLKDGRFRPGGKVWEENIDSRLYLLLGILPFSVTALQALTPRYQAWVQVESAWYTTTLYASFAFAILGGTALGDILIRSKSFSIRKLFLPVACVIMYGLGVTTQLGNFSSSIQNRTSSAEWLALEELVKTPEFRSLERNAIVSMPQFLMRYPYAWDPGHSPSYWERLIRFKSGQTVQVYANTSDALKVGGLQAVTLLGFGGDFSYGGFAILAKVSGMSGEDTLASSMTLVPQGPTNRRTGFARSAGGAKISVIDRPDAILIKGDDLIVSSASIIMPGNSTFPK